MEHEYFKKAAVNHGFFSLALLTFVGVGFYHTQNTDWDGSAPYWVFGVITGLMHFLGICCAMNCYGKRNSDTGMNTAVTMTTIKSRKSSKLDQIRPWTAELAALERLEKSPYTYNGRNLVITLAPSFLIGSFSFLQLGLYRILSCILIIWSFVGTVGTGVTGACADLGECVYKENQGVNKGMAITLLVLHIISFFYVSSVNGEVSKLYKRDGTAITTAPKPGQTIERPYLQSTTTTRSTEPPAYTIPLPTSYNILPPPSGTLPPPPSYESIMYCENPESDLRPSAPPATQPKPPPRLAPIQRQRKSSL